MIPEDVGTESESFSRRIAGIQARNTSTRPIGSTDLEPTLGNVKTNITLPKGRYSISFDIVINPEGILTIEPGTEILFGQGGGVVCYGGLIAVGLSTSRIRFTAANDQWKNVVFAGKLANASALEYCTLTHGHGRERIQSDYLESLDCGGAISVQRSAPTISNCTIEESWGNWGGGMSIYSGSSPRLQANRIANNRANCGGGLYIHKSSPVLINNVIQHNMAYDKGGGLYLFNSDPIMENNHINDNKPNDVCQKH